MDHELETLIEDYLIEKDIAKSSFELYDTILKQYVDYLKEKNIMYATKKDLLDYLAYKKSQNYSVSWLYNLSSTIRGLYKYLSENQERLNLAAIYKNDIAASISNPTRKHKLTKSVLTLEQAKHLITHTKENRKYIWQYRDYAMLYLMLTTGLRSVEVRRAKIKDMSTLGGKSILYIQGKGRRSSDEFVKLTKGVKDAIQDYLNKRTDKNPYLFVSHSHKTDIPYLSRTFFIKMFERVLTDCDLLDTKITPHSLRHSAATFNLMRGASLESTRQFMRHQDLSATLIYAHHVKRLDDDSEKEVESYILNETLLNYFLEDK